MAAQIFKDPYLFDMLGTADPRREAEVERALGIRSCAFGWPARLTSLETSSDQVVRRNSQRPARVRPKIRLVIADLDSAGTSTTVWPKDAR